MKVLVTGAAGFIGMHTCQRLLAQGVSVVGLDNMNAYYAVSLKQARLARLQAQAGFEFVTLDLADAAGLQRLLAQHRFTHVVHLAAQAGVRYSLQHPETYVSSNLVGFANMLEACRQQPPEHLIFASTSSVYGANGKTPFHESDPANHPLSFYAATKRANEAMAHSYSHLYRLPCTGLRFFTVYGPWGRPDMSPWLFTEAILAGRPIQVFNHGQMWRDFTYVDDIVEGVLQLLPRPATPNPQFNPMQPDPASSTAPYALYNIGNHQPVPLMQFIETLEQALGQRAEKIYLPMQNGDVPSTAADIERLQQATGFSPSTNLQTGLEAWVRWYRDIGHQHR